MTKLGREIWEEAFNSGREEGREEGRENEKRRIADRMIREGDSLEEIIDWTGLSEDTIRELQNKILQTA